MEIERRKFIEDLFNALISALKKNPLIIILNDTLAALVKMGGLIKKIKLKDHC